MTVHLVGAGPGDPGLLTLRGGELLREADVVVHDRLVRPEMLALARSDAELIDVGKSPGGPSTTQDDINALLVELGRSGRSIVRLKGGDPYVFGRGGEEAEVLRRAGIAYEVVPGITSAVAAPAAAGIPVTHRDHASGFAVITAHQDPATDRSLDWEALARSRLTLVVLMGASRAAAIAERLVDAGLAPDTPAAAVHRGTQPDQQVWRGRLADLGSEPIRPPATLVIGSVADEDLRDLTQPG
ncbi:uroporphyrinogen-III C-methyltransferase [Actinomarinicola tropica]|uniref:uroporphyrinogen-III C-methyltransferase n=1 Tax=Actinomarinicola tropica TaxID=2789776 RepID=A0A5Q2RNN5_9ACTN|nr:uroporphyrinogen-III C-methyltransferase [Actinomarinicola tropica]QGG96201.1 uroporphyrinogen-III C-methyltransferase [Actinomarinicola tropica]